MILGKTTIMKFQIPQGLAIRWQAFLDENQLMPAQAMLPFIEDYLSGQLPMQRMPYPRLRRKGQLVVGRSITIDSQIIKDLSKKIIDDEVSKDAFFRSLITYILDGQPYE